MLNILLMIILLIIIFIIILLYIGVKIAFVYNKTGSKFEGCLKILILKKIKVYSIDYPKEESDDEKEKEDESEDKNQRKDIKKILNLAKPCFGYFKQFIKSTAKSIKIAKLENHLVFGLDSYSDTGQYIGYIWAVLSVVNSFHKNARLSAEPSFKGSVLDARGENELNINLLGIIIPAIRLILKKEVRELIKGVRNG